MSKEKEALELLLRTLEGEETSGSLHLAILHARGVLGHLSLGKEETHPMQPLIRDEHGTVRFKANKIVRALMDQGPMDLNAIAASNYPQEDRVQLAQLIGYSLSGFGELSYVEEVLEAPPSPATVSPVAAPIQAQSRSEYRRIKLQGGDVMPPVAASQPEKCTGTGLWCCDDPDCPNQTVPVEPTKGAEQIEPKCESCGNILFVGHFTAYCHKPECVAKLESVAPPAEPTCVCGHLERWHDNNGSVCEWRGCQCGEFKNRQIGVAPVAPAGAREFYKKWRMTVPEEFAGTELPQVLRFAEEYAASLSSQQSTKACLDKCYACNRATDRELDQEIERLTGELAKRNSVAVEMCDVADKERKRAEAAERSLAKMKLIAAMPNPEHEIVSKPVERKVVRVDRSPMNPKVWCVQMDCGHEVWGAFRKPKVGTMRKCETCCRGGQ